MRPLRFELASKTGGKEVWEGSYFGGRTLADSLQTGGLETCGRRRSRRSTLVHPQGYTTEGEGQEKQYLKGTGYLKVRFIATCKVIIIFFIL